MKREDQPGGLESLGDLYDAVPASEVLDVEEDTESGGLPSVLLDLVLRHRPSD